MDSRGAHLNRLRDQAKEAIALIAENGGWKRLQELREDVDQAMDSMAQGALHYRPGTDAYVEERKGS